MRRLQTWLSCVMLGVAIVLYSLFLVAGMMGRYRPRPSERHLSVMGFIVLSSFMLGRNLPLLILPVLTFFLVAFLQRAK